MADRRNGERGELPGGAPATPACPTPGVSAFNPRALAISVLVAVALSIAATLLLGGGFRIFGVGASAGHWFGTIPCCPEDSRGVAR